MRRHFLTTLYTKPGTPRWRTWLVGTTCRMVWYGGGAGVLSQCAVGIEWAEHARRALLVRSPAVDFSLPWMDVALRTNEVAVLIDGSLASRVVVVVARMPHTRHVMTGWWCDDVGPRTQPKSQASCHGVHRRDYDPFCADCLPPSRHLAGIANADMVMLDLLFLFSNKGFRWVKSACMSVCVLATLAGQPRAFSKFQACLRANPCRCANACWGGPPPYTCACGIRVGTLMWAMRRPQTSSTGDSTDGLTPPCMWSHMDMDALVPSHDARMAWFVRSVGHDYRHEYTTDRDWWSYQLPVRWIGCAQWSIAHAAPHTRQRRWLGATHTVPSLHRQTQSHGQRSHRRRSGHAHAAQRGASQARGRHPTCVRRPPASHTPAIRDRAHAAPAPARSADSVVPRARP